MTFLIIIRFKRILNEDYNIYGHHYGESRLLFVGFLSNFIQQTVGSMAQRVVFAFLLLWACTCLIQIDGPHNLTALDFEDSLVRIVQNSINLNALSAYENRHFILITSNAHKRKSYELFKSRYQKTLTLLKNSNLIYSESSLIKSQIKSKYIPRTRMWEFSLSFVIQGYPSQLNQLQLEMEEIGVKVLKDITGIKYLEEKWHFLQVFHSAKLRLQEILNHYGGHLEVKEVDDVEIDDGDFESSDKIQQQLEVQHSEIPAIFHKDRLEKLALRDSEAGMNTTMEVVFRVGRRKQSSRLKNYNFTGHSMDEILNQCQNESS